MDINGHFGDYSPLIVEFKLSPLPFPSQAPCRGDWFVAQMGFRGLLPKKRRLWEFALLTLHYKRNSEIFFNILHPRYQTRHGEWVQNVSEVLSVL